MALGAAPERKPKYSSLAVPLSEAHLYFRNHEAPIFWALSSHYLHQERFWSCGVTSTAMVVNAARTLMKGASKLKADEPLATESYLVSKLKSKVWWTFFGWSIGKGIGLGELGAIVEESLGLYGVNPLKIETVRMDGSNEARKKLHDDLLKLENSGHLLMIANFLQSVYTEDADVGHFAPVAAYDSANKKVLIFDPDRKWYEPYWVSEDTFVQGMNTPERFGDHKNRGRMAESAAHLVDEVFPKAGIRQWVLSFPMPVRFILAKNLKLQTRVL
ncbi:unnamed protein product [Sphagnum tenellum]